jgi:hypothetical protein
MKDDYPKMETTALMNDSNTQILCFRTINRQIFVEQVIATAWAFDFLRRPYLISMHNIS